MWRPSAATSTSVAGLPTPPAVLSPSSSTTASSMRSRTTRRPVARVSPVQLRQVGRVTSGRRGAATAAAGCGWPVLASSGVAMRFVCLVAEQTPVKGPPPECVVRPSASCADRPHDAPGRRRSRRSSGWSTLDARPRHGHPRGRPAALARRPAERSRCRDVRGSATRSASSSSSATACRPGSGPATSTCWRRSSPCPRTSRPTIDKVRSPHFRGWERVGAELTDNRTDYREQLDVSTENPPYAADADAAVPAPRRPEPVAARRRPARLPPCRRPSSSTASAPSPSS